MRKFMNVFIVIVVLGLGILLAQRFQLNQRNRQLVVLEQAIQRSLNLCYAQEGFYPASIDYLVEHYGLVLDEQKVYVSYRVFASNIRPDITLFDRGE
jgi:hypothetical protein